MVTDDKIVCPSSAYTLEGAIDVCSGEKDENSTPDCHIADHGPSARIAEVQCRSLLNKSVLADYAINPP